MKFLPLVWAGIWRKSSRTVLLLLQIASAFLLFGLLQGLNSGVKKAISDAHSDRLYVGSSVSLGVPLPISMLPQIQRIRGVTLVTPLAQIPATYQTASQAIPLNAVDPAAFFGMFQEYIVAPAALQAMKRNRTAVIVGSALAERYKIKVGERLALQSPQPRRDGSNAWAFDVVGIFHNPTQPNNTSTTFVNFDYVNEARVADRDTSLLYIALADSPAHAAAVGSVIDKTFANSSHETRTQSEGDLISSQLQRIVDLDYIVGAIMSAVFFALLFATGALLMQSVRERVPELAVLKTFGFSDPLVMLLILTEALLFCIFSAAIGLGLAAIVLRLARDNIGISSIPASVFIAGLLFATALAILGGTPPAWRGLRLQVATALADR
jgi:putative ABC transport system permease protein